MEKKAKAEAKRTRRTTRKQGELADDSPELQDGESQTPDASPELRDGESQTPDAEPADGGPRVED